MPENQKDKNSRLNPVEYEDINEVHADVECMECEELINDDKDAFKFEVDHENETLKEVFDKVLSKAAKRMNFHRLGQHDGNRVTFEYELITRDHDSPAEGLLLHKKSTVQFSSKE